MNKNGFTLVELMITVAIILIVTLLITPRINKIVADNRNKGYKEIEKRLEEAAAKYIHEEYISSDATNITITKQNLIDAKYIDEIYDLKDNSVCSATVDVNNINSNPTFHVNLNCSNYNS